MRKAEDEKINQELTEENLSKLSVEQLQDIAKSMVESNNQ